MMDTDTANAMEEPITAEELSQALKMAKNGKSPGPDGFTIKYYRTYRDALIPHLLAMLNTLREGDNVGHKTSTMTEPSCRTRTPHDTRHPPYHTLNQPHSLNTKTIQHLHQSHPTTHSTTQTHHHDASLTNP
ncbi:Hypothetical predicted protein [Pelobates cultripes]|uniref:Reverse transcriptase n=1 Tax=Pelobates cultripes TaxID=61616 RepID=A0AAD1TPR5_PELCU|nr:Hypothetical predicted protein [Pelobates cultripes]